MSTQPFHVRFDSDPDHVLGIRTRCEAFARELGFDDKAVGEIGLCVNEAIANIIEHAYKWEKGRPIELWCERDSDSDGRGTGAGSASGGTGSGGRSGRGGIKLRIRDWGPGIDPSKLPVKPKDPLVPKGLGLICLREMMDAVEYAPQSDGGILLTISKTPKP